MGSNGQREHLERLFEPALVLEEVGVCHQAEAEAGEGLSADGNGVGDAVQVSAFGGIGRQLAEMTAHGIQLPEHPLLPSGAVIPHQHPVHQPRDEIRSQRQAGGQLAIPLMFATRALEKWRVRQDIGGRLDLTEELLRREQIASFHEKCRG